MKWIRKNNELNDTGWLFQVLLGKLAPDYSPRNFCSAHLNSPYTELNRNFFAYSRSKHVMFESNGNLRKIISYVRINLLIFLFVLGSSPSDRPEVNMEHAWRLPETKRPMLRLFIRGPPRNISIILIIIIINRSIYSYVSTN